MRGSLRAWAPLVAAVALFSAGVALGRTPDAPSAAHEPPTQSVAPTPALATSTPTPTEAPSAAVATPSPAATLGGPMPRGYRVAIPRLGIDLPLAEGDLTRDVIDQRTPEGYAFHLTGTALPGQSGNTYLYAHARAGMFLALWSARVGDEVLITAPDGRVLVYLVGEILPRVPPTDVSSTQPTTTERLTLQTSTGPSPSDPRFVVIAYPRG